MRILLVEDDKILAQVLRVIASKNGARTGWS